MSRAHWLALSTAGGLGGVTARKLLERFGDINSIFRAKVDELTGIPRVTPAIAAKLLAAPIEQLESDLLSLSEEGIDLLTWDDESFPAPLAKLPDAPMVLFLRGQLLPSDERAVGIVGTRDASPRGKEIARTLARELAKRELTVVSGLALGIDTAAHEGALDADDGRTLAILGSGILRIHPAENSELAARIIRRGALLSEFAPNAHPGGPQLMARNRIVSGMSRALIVIEAGARSGSLDAAARAAKQGRLLYAVGGSEGTDVLLAQGARPIEWDAVGYDALAVQITGHMPPAAQPSQGALW